MRWRWWAVGVTSLAAAIVVGHGTAAAEDTPAVDILPAGGIVVAGGGGTVMVVNNTTSPAGLDVSGEVWDSGGARWDLLVERRQPYAVKEMLTGGGTAVYSISGHPGTGALTVRATVSRGAGVAETTVVLHRPITVGAATPAPAVSDSKHELKLWTLPFGDGHATMTVPIDGTCPSTGWTAAPTLMSDSRAVVAKAECPAGGAAILVTAELPGADTYTGDLVVGDDTVKLSAKVSASVWWAVICLVLGVAAGLLQLSYLTNVRPFTRLRRRLDKVVNEAAKAQTAFWNDGQRPQPAQYTIEPTVAAAAGALFQRITAAKDCLGPMGRWLPRPAPDVAAEISRLSADAYELKASVDAWAGAARILATLPVTPPHERLAPDLAAHARALRDTNGRRELAPPEVRPLLKDVEATAHFLDMLPDVALLRDRLRARSGERPGYSQTEREWWERATGYVTATLTDLSAAKSGAELIESDVDRTLERARELESRLPAPPPSVSRGGLTLEGVVVEAGDELATLSSSSLLLDSLRRRWADVTVGVRRLRSPDVWVLLVVAAAAIWGGLVALYFDKVWGTPVDVVNALLAGYGAVVVASPLVQAIERVTEGDVELKAKA